jgi:hypothetical protein
MPILMHHMHISTIKVSSAMLMSKTLEIRKKKCENSNAPGKTQATCSEIELNQSFEAWSYA